MLTAIIGAALAVAFVLVREFMDVRIKSEEDLMEICDAPILGYIPELNQENTTKYSYTPHAAEDEEVAQ
jgi:capsular polysaccharide biosynthesis protein